DCVPQMTSGLPMEESQMWRSGLRIARWMTLVAVAALAGCRQPREDRRELEARARNALEALRTHDMPRLAALVHPQKGVRFSPHAYVHADSDLVLTREELPRLWTDTTKRVWGRFDASGESIRLTFPRYHRRLVHH